MGTLNQIGGENGEFIIGTDFGGGNFSSSNPYKKEEKMKKVSIILHTTGEPYSILAESDRSTINADRQSIAAIQATIRDENGYIVYNAANEVTCEIIGPARLIGIEDSNPMNTEDYKDNKQKAFHGKLLIYIQSLDQPGEITVSLSSPGLKGTSVFCFLRQ